MQKIYRLGELEYYVVITNKIHYQTMESTIVKTIRAITSLDTHTSTRTYATHASRLTVSHASQGLTGVSSPHTR